MTHACATHQPGVEIGTLSFSEQFVVWSVRAWVDGYKAGTGRGGLLREGFTIAGAADGWLLVEELMTFIASTAKRPLDMRCLACRTLGEDKAPLLAGIAGLQHKDEAPAVVTVGNWPPPSAVPGRVGAPHPARKRTPSGGNAAAGADADPHPRSRSRASSLIRQNE